MNGRPSNLQYPNYEDALKEIKLSIKKLAKGQLPRHS